MRKVNSNEKKTRITKVKKEFFKNSHEVQPSQPSAPCSSRWLQDMMELERLIGVR